MGVPYFTRTSQLAHTFGQEPVTQEIDIGRHETYLSFCFTAAGRFVGLYGTGCEVPREEWRSYMTTDDYKRRAE
jgi:hypothetical protein